MPITPVPIPEDVVMRGVHVVRGRYDFAVDGGVQGTIAITAGTPIPSGSTIVGGYVDIITPVTSGGSATVAVQVEAANDVVNATGKASWTAGVKNVLPSEASGSITSSTYVRTTAARNISIVVGTADLTAGKFDVVLFVIPPAG